MTAPVEATIVACAMSEPFPPQPTKSGRDDANRFTLSGICTILDAGVELLLSAGDWRGTGRHRELSYRSVVHLTAARVLPSAREAYRRLIRHSTLKQPLFETEGIEGVPLFEPTGVT